MKDDIPDHLKFGYAHSQEIRALEIAIAEEMGMPTDRFIPEVYFAARRRYDHNHRNDPTYRERQEAAKARGEKWVAPDRPAGSSDRDRFKAALVAIRDGHNDPRGLAKQVLDDG